MGYETGIEWTDHTFNPWWGCVKVSPGCNECYAERDAKRFGHKIWGKDAPRRFFGADHWIQPIKWNLEAMRLGVRRKVFCGSHCDVMETRPELQPERARLYGVIDETPNLDWLLLTKRPQNFIHMFPEKWLKEPRPNVWLMASVESDEFLWRVDRLLEVPAAVHGLSIEPLLGPLDLSRYMLPKRVRDGFRELCATFPPEAFPLPSHLQLRRTLDWVIAGGESGSRARAAQADWFRRLRDDCVSTDTPFFFKQWGEHSEGLVRIGKRKAGRLLDGVEWSQFPEV